MKYRNLFKSFWGLALATVVVVFVMTGCFFSKEIAIGETKHFEGISSEIHSYGYYSREGEYEDSSYINLYSKDEYSFQLRMARDELFDMGDKLNKFDEISFDGIKEGEDAGKKRYRVKVETVKGSND